MSPSGVSSDKGLPTNPDAERFVLGSILMDDSAYIQCAGVLEPDDFSLEKHRRIFVRMGELHERGEQIDRVTLANELLRHGELESCDGLSYLVSLDDGLPQIYNLESYFRIVKDKVAAAADHLHVAEPDQPGMLGEEEPDQILAGAEETLLKLGESRVKAGLAIPRQVIAKYEGGVNAFLDPSKRIKGISTGFTKFDEMTGGLHEGELVILAARPSMGKTALALNIAQSRGDEAGEDGGGVLARNVEGIAADPHALRGGARRQPEVSARAICSRTSATGCTRPLNALGGSAALHRRHGRRHLMDMHAKLRRLQKAETGLGLVVVDYLQLMSGRGRFENRNQEISAISRGMKLLAKELNVPMLVLSQLSRAPETRQGDHRPQLSDLRESGSIEQDADLVAFIFREEVYKPDHEDLKGVAELILAKQRNGPGGQDRPGVPAPPDEVREPPRGSGRGRRRNSSYRIEPRRRAKRETPEPQHFRIFSLPPQ